MATESTSSSSSSSSSPIDYYEILHCNPSDSIDDIKKSYQQLILKHHPDKKSTCSSRSSSSCKTSDIEAFHRIDTAWKLLRDPEQRKKYDAEMQQHRFNDEPIVHANCYRTDFQFDSETECYMYPCRCGGFFVLPDEFKSTVDNSDISQMDDAIEKQPATASNASTVADDEDEIYIECDECSFVVRLISDKR